MVHWRKLAVGVSRGSGNGSPLTFARAAALANGLRLPRPRVHIRVDIRTKNKRGLVAGLNGTELTTVAIAGAAFAWTLYRDIGHRRALALATGERKAAETRADEPRPEQVTTLKREARRENDKALLVGTAAGASSGSHSGVDFPLSVQNDGGAPAQDVTVWLTLDTPGVAPEQAYRLTQPHSVPVLMPGDPALPFSLRQVGPFYGARVERDGLIVAAWKDGSGDHVDKIGRLTVFQ